MQIRKLGNMLKDHKKAVVISIIALFTAFCVLAAALVFHFVPESKYRIKSFFVTAFSSCKLTRVSYTQLDDYTLEELADDPRVTFDQSLMLINPLHPLEKEAFLSIGEYKDSTVYMNECVFGAYESLAKAVGDKYGTKLYVKSAYRTWQEQEAEYAENPAATLPGTSEHQAGLALDVYVPYHAGYAFIECEEGQFVASNGYEHGFIIRYPYYATEITGIGYEPWHIRYVGAPHAELITKNKLCLEEYVESLKKGVFYEYDRYTVTRQSCEDGTLRLPNDFASAVISPDNCGGYIVTLTR